MGQIKNTTKYPIIDPVGITDYVIGSESGTGVTKNYMWLNVFNRFLEQLGLIDIQYSDVEDEASLYDYHGGIKAEDNWIINRYLKTDVTQKTKAVFGSNQGYFDIDSAWINRATLIYI